MWILLVWKEGSPETVEVAQEMHQGSEAEYLVPIMFKSMPEAVVATENGLVPDGFEFRAVCLG